MHGNGSASVFYDEDKKRDLANALIKKGISLLRFNNRGAHIIKKINVAHGDHEDRLKYGCAYEIIKECVYDIDAAVKFLKKLGYREFYLVGGSTGANKISVYNHYKPKNVFKKYVLISPGDDTGMYYSMLGKKTFEKLLLKSKNMIKKGKGTDLATEFVPEEVLSYQSFYDMCNPDGDYNVFPYLEKLESVKLSKKPLFRYFKEIKKSVMVAMGEFDEFAYGKVPEIMKMLDEMKPEHDYFMIEGADHGFTGKEADVAEVISDWLTG